MSSKLFLSILILFVLASLLFISSVGASTMWSQTYGSGGAHSLVETSDGGYAIAGGGLLLKTDAYGNMEWNQTYGGAGDEQAFSLVETSDRGYALAGYTTSVYAGPADFWLVKTDEYGNIPEFPSWIILPLFLIATSLAITIKKRLFRPIS